MPLRYVPALITFNYSAPQGTVYTMATAHFHHINVPCHSYLHDQVRRHMIEMRATHLYVEGRCQANFLRRRIPGIPIYPLPPINIEECQDCHNSYCTVNQIRRYFAELFYINVNISCI